jgi:hypothetical protein
VGNYDLRTGAVTEHSPGFVLKTSIYPPSAPAEPSCRLTSVKTASTRDTLMDGFSPSILAARSMVDYPSCYHNGAGGLNFAMAMLKCTDG